MLNLFKDDALKVLNDVDINWFEDSEILITGASGLLGINLISILKYSNLKFNCTLIVNSNPEKVFLDLIKDDVRFKYIQKDLTVDFDGIDYSNCNYFYDAIFHFATYGQPNKIFNAENMDNQINTIKLNTEVTIKLLDLLRIDGKFVFLSTSEVYQGLSGKHKETEIGTTTPEHTRACYIEAKRCGETICNIYKNQGYDIKIIRLCLGYGIGVKPTDKRALNSFIFEGLENGIIDLMDKGMAIRSYCYIYDVLEMILNIMINGKDLVYNVGGKEIITIKQLAFNIGSILNIPISIPEEDVKLNGATTAVILNIDKYINEFGDKKFLNINDGLRRTIKWWKLLLKG